jgi:hypothetical protein
MGSNKPLAPTAPAGTTQADLDAAKAYNEAITKYNLAVPQYEADQAVYNTYKGEYQNRLANTPMYSAAQYSTAPTTVEDLYRTYLNRAPEQEGADYWAKQFGSEISPAEIQQFRNAAVNPANIARAKELNLWNGPQNAPITNTGGNVSIQGGLDELGNLNGSMPYQYNTGLKPQRAPLQSPTYGAIPSVPGVSVGFTPLAPMALPTVALPAVVSTPATFNSALNQYTGGGADSAGGMGDSAGADSGPGPGSSGPGGSSGDVGASEGGATPGGPGDGTGPGSGGGPGDGGLGDTAGSGNSGGDNGADGDGGDGDGGDGWYRGGRIKTRFASGGLNDLSNKYEAQPEQLGFEGESAAPATVNPMAAQAPAGRMDQAGLAAMLERYQPAGSNYGTELAAARATAGKETEAFNAMLQKAIGEQTDNAPSKAEMYFRLAAAFGAPTKTGAFMESVGNVGKTMSEYAKEQRDAAKAGSATRLQLGLEAQKAKMTGAKEDLSTLRGLAGEEMKDKRTIATELLKDYVKSGQPQSTAGKQALDEGLVAGTPAFQKRVSEISALNVDRQMAGINASLANIGVAQANQALAQSRFDQQKAQAAKLTGPEMKLKTETEDMLAQTEQAQANLRKAFSLNPNTFDASLIDIAQRKVLEAAGSKDEKVQNTREMENLLEKAALSSLKSTFPGAISNDERKALQDVQGLGAKSKEERAKIMKSGYTALKTVSDRARARLKSIEEGKYRDTTPSITGEIE